MNKPTKRSLWFAGALLTIAVIEVALRIYGPTEWVKPPITLMAIILSTLFLETSAHRKDDEPKR